MMITPESQAQSPPATPAIPLNEKKPGAVKAAIITGVVNLALIFGFAAMVLIFNIIGGKVKNVIIPVLIIVALIAVLDALAGIIYSIIVLVRHKRWKKAGMFGLLANMLPMLFAILIYIFIVFYIS